MDMCLWALSYGFDSNWELSKDKLQVFQECEYRYVCVDCRVKTLNEEGMMSSKTYGCKYNPAKEEWLMIKHIYLSSVMNWR